MGALKGVEQKGMAPAREVAVPSATYLCSTTFHSFDGFDFDHLVPHTPFGSGIWLNIVREQKRRV